MLKIESFTLRREHDLLLSVDSLELAEGELGFIIGGNGSGKTTLIKAILGLYSDYSGNITAPTASAIGYVPQYIDIDRAFPITVAEFLELECTVSCAFPQEHLELFGIEQLRDEKLGKLSGGELQKVLLVRSFIRKPRLLIMDEPTNNLDSVSIKKLFALLNENLAQGHSAVIITHDHNLIDEHADQIFNIENKELSKITKVSQLHKHD